MPTVAVADTCSFLPEPTNSTCLPPGSSPSSVNNICSLHPAITVHALPLPVRVRTEEPQPTLGAADRHRVTQEGGKAARLRRPPVLPPPRLPPLPHHLLLLPPSPPTVSHLPSSQDELARLARFPLSKSSPIPNIYFQELRLASPESTRWT